MIVRRHYRHVQPGGCMLCHVRMRDPEPLLCSLCGSLATAVMRPWFDELDYPEIVERTIRRGGM